MLNPMFTEPQTYATRINAERKLSKVLGDCKDDVRYLIMSTPCGRFSPVVCLRQQQSHMMLHFANQGVCVMMQ